MVITGTWGQCLSQGQAEGCSYPEGYEWGCEAASSESSVLGGGIQDNLGESLPIEPIPYFLEQISFSQGSQDRLLPSSVAALIQMHRVPSGNGKGSTESR